MKYPLYILPGELRIDDRIVASDRLRIEKYYPALDMSLSELERRSRPIGLKVSIDGAEAGNFPFVMPCAYRPEWADVRAAAASMGLKLVLDAPVRPDDLVGRSAQRFWLASADGGVYTSCVSGDLLIAQEWPIRLEAATIARLNEPARQLAGVRSIADACLRDHGWTLLPEPHAAIAEKSIQTAAGERSALAYLTPFDSEFCNCTLKGEYWSEGRNALEPHSVLIPRDCPAEEVLRRAAHFVTNAEQVIAETYAVRLFLRPERGG